MVFVHGGAFLKYYSPGYNNKILYHTIAFANVVSLHLYAVSVLPLYYYIAPRSVPLAARLPLVCKRQLSPRRYTYRDSH